jgi:hypothetical protein
VSSTAYVVVAYGTFAGLVSAYVAILVPRTRARRSELAALEAAQERAGS